MIFTKNKAKEKLSSKIARDEKDFLAGGGKIQFIPNNVYDKSHMNYRELDKRNYARKQRGEI